MATTATLNFSSSSLVMASPMPLGIGIRSASTDQAALVDMHFDAPVTMITGLNMVRRRVKGKTSGGRLGQGGEQAPIFHWLPQRRTRTTPSRKVSASALKSQLTQSSPSLPHSSPPSKRKAMATRTAVSNLLRARSAAATRARAAPSSLAARRRGYASEPQHSVSIEFGTG